MRPVKDKWLFTQLELHDKVRLRYVSMFFLTMTDKGLKAPYHEAEDWFPKITEFVAIVWRNRQSDRPGLTR